MINLNGTYRVLGTDPDREPGPVVTSLANKNELSHAQGLAKQKEILSLCKLQMRKYKSYWA